MSFKLEQYLLLEKTLLAQRNQVEQLRERLQQTIEANEKMIEQMEDQMDKAWLALTDEQRAELDRRKTP